MSFSTGPFIGSTIDIFKFVGEILYLKYLLLDNNKIKHIRIVEGF